MVEKPNCAFRPLSGRQGWYQVEVSPVTWPVQALTVLSLMHNGGNDKAHIGLLQHQLL